MNRETIEYLKSSNKNQFGYEQDKLISYDDAQELVEHLEVYEQRKYELEQENKQLQQELDKYKHIVEEIKEYCKGELESEYWGNDSYINGKNEENFMVCKSVMNIIGKILEREE